MLVPGTRHQSIARPLRRRRCLEPQPIHVESDLACELPVSGAELDAIEQLLGPDLRALLAD